MSALPDAEVRRRDFIDLMAASYNDPLFFFKEGLRAKKLRGWQEGLLEEVRDRRLAGEKHTMIHARTSHTSGKTWLAGGICIWWQGTRRGARTFTTAPTKELLESRLWVEIRKQFASAIPQIAGLGDMLVTRWHTGGDKYPDWYAIGSTSDDVQNLEGLHSWAMARIIDEAKAVEDKVYTATEGMFFGSDETLDVMISTPSVRMGKFYERDLNYGSELIRRVVTIEDLIRDGVAGAVEAKRRAIIEYGGEHTFEYRSRAMAEYIDNAEGALFPFSWIERAMLTDEEREKAGLPVWHVGGPPTLGFDVAGSVDGDHNAVAPVHGPDSELRYEVKDVRRWHERDTMVSKDKVVELARELRARCVRVDVQGLGKGVSDALVREITDRHLTLFVEEYRSADPAGTEEAQDRFLNRKAENAWEFRLSLEQDRIRLPKSPELRKQMSAIKYEVRNGKIRVVDPDDSPDDFDACLMGHGGVVQRFKPSDVGGGGQIQYGPIDKDASWTTGEAWPT